MESNKITMTTDTGTADKSLIELMNEKSEGSGRGLGPVPVGSLADQPIRELVKEANKMDLQQSFAASIYGGIATREAMIQYYAGNIDRALVALEECSTDALFARLYEMAEEADLDDRPRPWGAH
jgi:hypothetical protein